MAHYLILCIKDAVRFVLNRIETSCCLDCRPEAKVNGVMGLKIPPGNTFTQAKHLAKPLRIELSLSALEANIYPREASWLRIQDSNLKCTVNSRE
jgi:hypothetical protein